VAEKHRIVQLTLDPGAKLGWWRGRRGVNANQVFACRRAFERGQIAESSVVSAGLPPVIESFGRETVQASTSSSGELLWSVYPTNLFRNPLIFESGVGLDRDCSAGLEELGDRTGDGLDGLEPNCLFDRGGKELRAELAGDSPFWTVFNATPTSEPRYIGESHLGARNCKENQWP
jgi:hypothetical protein